MTSASVESASKVSQSVMALKAWHQLNIEDVASAANISEATLHRRLATGRYLYAEVKAFAAYFGLPIEALESGEFSLRDSELQRGAVKSPRADSNRRHTAYNSVQRAQMRDLVAA